MAKTLPPIGQRIDVDFNELRHPDYERMYTRWKMQWDFWRGGLCVMSPDYPATAVRYGVQTTTDDSAGGEAAEIPRRGSGYEWRTTRTNSYLWKHPRETMNEYQERQARQDHYPLFQSITNIFVSGILRTSATYQGSMSPAWKEYHRDVDMCGTSFSAFVRQALSIAIAMGRCHAVTDRPMADTGAVSRFEEDLRGDRTYSWLVTPLDLVDWELDAQGRFIWARIREPDNSRDSWRRPTDAINDDWSQYRIWHRDYWELVRLPRSGNNDIDSDVAWTRVAAGYHGLGEVPVATLYAGKDGRPTAMDTESPLSDVCDADRKLLNRQSEMDELERAQAFALLAIPEAESGPGGGVDIGPFRAFTYPSEAGAPTYINPDQTILKGKSERIGEAMHIVRQLAGAGRGKAEFSKEERSAAALSLESTEKHNLMAIWAESTQEFDAAVHRHVSEWSGGDSWPEAAYDRVFDLRAISSQIQDIVQLSAVDELRPAIAPLGKPIINRILREAGVSDEVIDRTMAKIDERAAAPVPAPVAPPSPESE